MDIGSLSGDISLNDKLSDSLTIAASHVKSFSDSFDGVGSSVTNGIEHPMDAAKEAVTSMLSELGPAGVGLVAVGAVAVATGTALFELADSAAKAGEGVLQFSRVTNTAVEDIGAISAAATIAGGSLDGMQGMLTQMQRRLDATGPAADKLDAALLSINVDSVAFRAADPSDRIAILASGMQNAAAGTNLMSVALATMGRGGVQNLGMLMQYTDDVREKGEELGVTWDTVTVKAAEDLAQATRTTGVEMSTLSTSIGIALTPAVTLAVEGFNRFILALEHVADLGGLVSGTWETLTGWLGKTALATETAGAVQDTTTKLWANAAAAGLSLSDATYDVATKMLDLGYNVKTVAEQTGLSTTEVDGLAKALKVAEQATADFDAATLAVNDGIVIQKFSVNDVSQGLQDYIVKLVESGKDITQVGLAMGYTADQVKLLVAAQDNAEQVAEANATKLQKLQDQMDAAAQKLAEQTEALSEKLDIKLYSTKADLYATDSQKLATKHLADYDMAVAEAQKKGVTDVDYYNKLWELYGLDLGKDQEIYNTKDLYSRQHYQLLADTAHESYEKALNDFTSHSKTEIDMLAAADRSAQQIAMHWVDQADKDIAALKTSTKTTASDMVGSFDSIGQAIDAMNAGLDASKIKVVGLDGAITSLADAIKKLNAGNSITYDLSTAQGLQYYKSMNPGATYNMSDANIEMFTSAGGTLSQLINMGAINPYGAMAKSQMPGFDTGGPVAATGPAIVHAGEYVIPKDGTLVSGGGSPIIINAQGLYMSVQQLTDAISEAQLRRSGRKMGAS
jgi:hypothetical protein